MDNTHVYDYDTFTGKKSLSDRIQSTRRNNPIELDGKGNTEGEKLKQDILEESEKELEESTEIGPVDTDPITHSESNENIRFIKGFNDFVNK